MNIRSLSGIRKLFQFGLDAVEYLGLLVIAFATTWSMFHETSQMWAAGRAALSDLLLMFLYLEVLAMIGQYFRSGQLPVRFPLYIAIVALARYMILDAHSISEWRMLAISAAILLLTLAVLIVRFGHMRYPYADDRQNPEADKSS